MASDGKGQRKAHKPSCPKCGGSGKRLMPQGESRKHPRPQMGGYKEMPCPYCAEGKKLREQRR